MGNENVLNKNSISGLKYKELIWPSGSIKQEIKYKRAQKEEQQQRNRLLIGLLLYAVLLLRKKRLPLPRPDNPNQSINTFSCQ